jgi:hypothetical protein
MTNGGIDVAFCDFCKCSQCQTGYTGVPRFSVAHAQTACSRWICDVCFQYDVCVHGQRAAGELVDPCEDMLCKHRPRIVSEWTDWKFETVAA